MWLQYDIPHTYLKMTLVITSGSLAGFVVSSMGCRLASQVRSLQRCFVFGFRICSATKLPGRHQIPTFDLCVGRTYPPFMSRFAWLVPRLLLYSTYSTHAGACLPDGPTCRHSYLLAQTDTQYLLVCMSSAGMGSGPSVMNLNPRDHCVSVSLLLSRYSCDHAYRHLSLLRCLVRLMACVLAAGSCFLV